MSAVTAISESQLWKKHLGDWVINPYTGHKLRIQTRSAMVERDFDILKAHPGQVLLGTSLPYLDDGLARVLEPRATGPTRRVRMLEKAADIGIPIYMRIAPVYPFHGIEVVADVVRRTAHQPLRQVFCEVNMFGQRVIRVWRLGEGRRLAVRRELDEIIAACRYQLHYLSPEGAAEREAARHKEEDAYAAKIAAKKAKRRRPKAGQTEVSK